MAVRVTQVPVETSVAPDTGQVRVTQVYVETSILWVNPNPATFYVQEQLPTATWARRGLRASQQQASFFTLVPSKRRQPNVFVVN